MITFAKSYFLIFAVLTLLGGVMGFVNKGSMASLIAGGVAAVLLAVAWWWMGANPAGGLVVALVVSLLLAGRFAPAFFKTGSWMPHGLMAVLSALGLVLGAIALFQQLRK